MEVVRGERSLFSSPLTRSGCTCTGGSGSVLILDTLFNSMGQSSILTPKPRHGILVFQERLGLCGGEAGGFREF